MKNLIQHLEQYNPDNSNELDFKKQMLLLLEEHGYFSFSRENTSGHFTASAWIIDSTYSHVLLLHHQKLDKWLQPGGHADGETALEKVALKEAEEETGVLKLQFLSDTIFDLDIHTIPERKNEAEHLHYDVRFAFLCKDKEAVTINHESKAFKWVPLKDIQVFTQNESILRMARKTHNLRKHD